MWITLVYMVEMDTLYQVPSSNCASLYVEWLQSILEKKKNKGILKVGQSRSGGLIISQKQGQTLIRISDTDSNNNPNHLHHHYSHNHNSS